MTRPRNRGRATARRYDPLLPRLFLGAALAALVLATPARLTAQDDDTQSPPGITRNERIMRHQERIRKLLEKRRQKQEQLRANQVIDPLEGKRPTPAPPAPKAPAPPPMVIAAEGNIYLVIRPAAQAVEVKQEFDTEVAALNDALAPVDEFEVLLSYEPQKTRLLRVSDAPLRPLLDGEPTYSVNPTSGIVHYRARLTRPYHFHDQALLRLRWLALTPSAAQFVFRFDPEKGRPTTSLRLAGKERLGKEDQPFDGALSGYAQVGMARRLTDRPLLASLAATGGDRLGLRMTTDKPRVAAGEELVVSVGIDNPAGQYLDTARVSLWYDPVKLEILDWDRLNWIRKGVNAYDGFARDHYPFSFHHANRADNERGELLYEMGMADRFIPPGGDLFRVRFRALEADPENAIWFNILPVNDEPATALFFEGRNILDYVPLIFGDGLALAAPIDPAPPTPAPQAEAPAAAGKPASPRDQPVPPPTPPLVGAIEIEP